MTLWFDVARIAAVLNLVLLAGLGYVWVRNYLDFRTKHTLGLLLFTVFLFAENAYSLYLYQWHPTVAPWFASSMPPTAGDGMMALGIFEMIGLAILTWVTFD